MQVLNGGPAPGSSWFVLLTLPQCERSAVAGLVARGYRAYGPTIKKQRPSGRRDADGRAILREIDGPMFTGYAFIRDIAGREQAICAVPGVRDFLRGSEQQILSMPQHAMDLILKTEAEQLAEYSEAQARAAYKRVNRKRKKWRALTAVVAEVSALDDAARNEWLLGMVGLGNQAEAA